jgi:dehydrogenase/reductase SDR family protein 12
MNSISALVQQGWRSSVFGIYGFQAFTKQAFIKKEKSFEESALQVDGQGQVALVTGANSGLGFATVKALLDRKFKVLMICRNKERGQAAKKELESLCSDAQLDLHIVDMSRPKEISHFVSNLSASLSISILVNNAGVLLEKRTETPDGLETVFGMLAFVLIIATNTLGVYHLTKLLLSHLKEGARIINVSSGGMYNVKLETEDLQWKNKPYDGALCYSQTKRAEVVLAALWAKHYPQFYFYSMHPGWAETPGLAFSLPSFNNMMKSYLRTAEQGADTIVYAAVSQQIIKEAENGITPSGSFLFDRKAVDPHVCGGGTKVDVSVVMDLCKKLDEMIVNLA